MAMFMSHHSTYRRKPVLSLHQQQIRFLTRLSIFVSILLFGALFWLANRPGFLIH